MKVGKKTFAFFIIDFGEGIAILLVAYLSSGSVGIKRYEGE